MLKTFANAETEAVFNDQRPAGIEPRVLSAAKRKLEKLNRAKAVGDMRFPLGNRLHRLEHGRAGQWSISVSSTWRICFRWHEGDAYEVELIDYHK